MSEFNISENYVKDAISTLANNLRAEKQDTENFAKMFADPSIIKNIDNVNNQIIFGRRGTGKTHLFFAIQERIIRDKIKSKKLPVYLDIRKILPVFSNFENNYQEYSLLILNEILKVIIDSIITNKNYIFEISEIDPNKFNYSFTQQINAELDKLNLSFDGKSILKLGEIELLKEMNTSTNEAADLAQ